MEEYRTAVIKAVRGCLISTKGKVEIGHLDNDYRTLLGERIPYFKLGYKRLEDFLQSDSSLIVTRNSNGQVFVTAEDSPLSAHISDMVHKQKPEKKKVLRRTVRFTTYPKPAKTTNWRPRELGPRGKKFVAPPRLAKVSHSQFINKPSVASKVVIPETSALHPKNIQRQNSEPKKSNIGNRLHLNGTTAPVKAEPCSSLTSTRKRITQKMSELSFGNEHSVGPMGDGAHVVKSTEFVPTGDPSKDLKTFVDLYKIGELEVSSKFMKTKQIKMYTCRIKVGKNTYTSYPEEFKDPAAAERHCAQEALDDLVPRYGRKKSLLLASDMDILERIPPMLEKHNHGIWVWQLQLDYADRYNEQLPADWLKIIDSSPCIQVEKCLDNYVLRHCKPGDALQKGQPKRNAFLALSDVSVPSNTVQFADDGRLYAEVTCVMSANEIWCRQHSTEESEAYAEMIGNMETHYGLHSSELTADTIAEAGYYAARYDKQWYRVRAVATSEADVHCFFIDHGDEMAVPRTDVFRLKREFALSQAQAFVCRLAGLEELYEASARSENIQGLLYRQVILEMSTECVGDENPQDLSIPVFMYDYESGSSINQEMIPLLTIESASPVIQKNAITEVYVSNIEPNGDVYVQLHSHGYNSLQTLLVDLEERVLADPPTESITAVTRENSKGKVYFAKYKLDGHWYRVQLIDWSPKGDLAQIYFADYGNTDVINVREDVLYPLEVLSDVLSQYPFQAVKVKMAVEQVPEDFVALAGRAMPEDQPVLLKVVGYDEGGVPLAEFFKRSTDGGLFCINKSVTMEAEIKKGEESSHKGAKKKLTKFDNSKNVPSGGSLPDPPLPDKGAYFEVHIPFAVNPYNFFVQPFASRSKLYKMMHALQDRYGDVTYSPLHVDQIVPGNIYASKHDDGYWYRTSVIKVIHSGSISVFYCDFGYYANLTVQQLVPLDAEFVQLPYQALKAKLSGIKPTQSKWTMADCDEFRALIERKNFYSIIADIEKDELYDSDIVLRLILIDTSTDDDIYIGEELIKKGIAVQA